MDIVDNVRGGYGGVAVVISCRFRQYEILPFPVDANDLMLVSEVFNYGSDSGCQ